MCLTESFEIVLQEQSVTRRPSPHVSNCCGMKICRHKIKTYQMRDIPCSFRNIESPMFLQTMELGFPLSCEHLCATVFFNCFKPFVPLLVPCHAAGNSLASLAFSPAFRFCMFHQCRSIAQNRACFFTAGNWGSAPPASFSIGFWQVDGRGLFNHEHLRLPNRTTGTVSV
jgi:hypothetical protein